MEDMSHAALSMLFVDAMHRAFPSVVTRSIVVNFSETFTKDLLKGKKLSQIKKPADIARFLDGTNVADNGDIRSCVYFMVLSTVGSASTTVSTCNGLYEKFNYPKNSNYGFFEAFK